MRLWTFLPLLLGIAALIGLAAWSGIAEAARGVMHAAWVLPGLAGVHLAQLFLSGLAWRVLAPGWLPMGRAMRLRLVREGINSMLLAQVGGELVAVRLLVRSGTPAPLAAAATTLDLTLEAMALPLFVLLGAGVLLAIGADRTFLLPVLGAVGVAALGAGGFVLAQRAGLWRLVEGGLRRFAPASLQVDGLHDAVARIARDRRALAWGLGLHVAAWAGGTFEIWLALWALGHPVGLAEAFVIESLGMAARGAGFAVPGGLGVQEGGYLLAAGLFGVAPETALAMSALKRVREALVGTVGLGLWQWAEARRQVAPARP